jgi:hypothetical protein
VPTPPDLGFIGRDSSLLRVDRLISTKRVILLHGPDGQGKTALAAEFARWYVLTGGVTGKAVYTDLAVCDGFAAVLDTLASAYEDVLRLNGVDWAVLTERERALRSREVLQTTPTLWLLDDFQDIYSKKSLRMKPWSDEEQARFLTFMRQARESTQLLLISNTDEYATLGVLPVRMQLPPFHFSEMFEIIARLGERFDVRVSDAEPWEGLIEYVEGSAKRLIDAASEVLLHHRSTRQAIGVAVESLRAKTLSKPVRATKKPRPSCTVRARHEFAKKEGKVQFKYLRGGSKRHFKIRLYVGGRARDLDRVREVAYDLGASYEASPDGRIRVATSRESSFDTLIWAYETFQITADVTFKSGVVKAVPHLVEITPPRKDLIRSH